MSRARAGMTAYKTTSPGTTVEIADVAILPADGFGTIEVDLDQLGTTTKPVNMVTAAYVLELSSVSTLGGGRGTTIPSPGRSPKQPLPRIGLHDPLHGRQACPEFNSFHQRVGQISPPEVLFSCRPFPKRGQICYIPSTP